MTVFIVAFIFYLIGAFNWIELQDSNEDESTENLSEFSSFFYISSGVNTLCFPVEMRVFLYSLYFHVNFTSKFMS